MELRFALGDRQGPLAPGLLEQARELLQQGGNGVLDAQTLLAIREQKVVGAMTVSVDKTCPEPCLGDLPAREAFLSKLVWTQGDWSEAPRFVQGGISRVQRRIGLALQWRFSQRDSRWEPLLRVALESGMKLFQEKRSYSWNQASPALQEPLRFEYKNILDLGTERFREILTDCGEGTLDRNDARYRHHSGAFNWGRAFMGYYAEADAQSWLVAYNSSRQPVGFVAVSSLPDPRFATIVYIGVLPRFRGGGVIDDLLRAGVSAARKRGFTQMCSDADVNNGPMCAAFERNGHLASLNPRLSWQFRSLSVGYIDDASEGKSLHSSPSLASDRLSSL